MRAVATGSVHELKKLREIERFRHTAKGSLHKSGSVRHPGISRHQDDGCLRPHRPAHFDELQAAQPRHVEVREHGVITTSFHVRQSFEAVASGVHVISAVRQGHSGQIQNVLIVVDDQYPLAVSVHGTILLCRNRL
ncbi:MAG: hypothetical protein A4E19_19695 [Nitrospira sp. SG-bin1]|nr:MAG: hypothetical protein A4E19_19695 [Nitrospira sp. SG-bin1]